MTTVTASGSHCVHFYEPNRFPSKHIAEFHPQRDRKKRGHRSRGLRRPYGSNRERDRGLWELVSEVSDPAGLWSVVNTDILLRALLSGVSVKRSIGNAISPTVQMARDKSPTGRIRIYGEFVDAVLKLGKPDVCLELERYGNQIAAENVADVYCGYSADAFPDAGCAKPFTKVCLLHNLIHTNLKDHNDWRYRMALGIAQAQSDSF